MKDVKHTGDDGVTMFVGVIFASCAVGYLTRPAWGCLTFGVVLIVLGLIEYFVKVSRRNAKQEASK